MARQQSLDGRRVFAGLTKSDVPGRHSLCVVAGKWSAERSQSAWYATRGPALRVCYADTVAAPSGLMSGEPTQITVLLKAAQDGDKAASDRLFEAVYDELRLLAGSHRRRWHGNATMSTTALINELFLKLATDGAREYANRTHFFATASKAMRHVLVNYAREQRRVKRGGDALQVTFDDVRVAAEISAQELLDLEAVLERLEARNPRQCRVVECRVFSGMSVEETAEALGISTATAKRDWRAATAQIYRVLNP